MPPGPYHGLLVLDKPGGLTSRDAVDRAQRWFPGGTRLGHTGTLDPLATGVLVLCVGAATRLTEYVQRMEKVYRTTLALDRRSDTDDLDGVVEHVVFPGPHPDRAEVERCLQSFLGEIEQVPPAFSAAKVAGRRAYALARQGEEVALAPRRVRIHAIEVLAYEYPLLELRVRCGKGTYIRSLARDVGAKLGCAGMVTALRRTRVGPFTEAQAFRLDVDAATARAGLLPLSAAVADLPRVTLPDPDIVRLRQGQAVPFARDDGAEVAVFDPAGNLVAVATVEGRGGLLRPAKVLPAEPGRVSG
jgi:tRNA pseudouridine55 synthase